MTTDNSESEPKTSPQPDADPDTREMRHPASDAVIEVCVVLDSFGGDWTPVTAVPTADVARDVQTHLEADAPATYTMAPYYPTREAVTADEPAPVTLSEGDTLAVVFDNTTVHGVAPTDAIARALHGQTSGLRTGIPVYESADALAADRPAVTGQFIDAEHTASDFLSDLR